MKVSNLFVSIAAAATVVSAIGVAYAQTSSTNTTGPTGTMNADTTTNRDNTTGSTGTMNPDSTSGMATRDASGNRVNDGSALSERTARTDRN